MVQTANLVQATGRRTVFICRGTGCTSSKSDQIQALLEKEVSQLGLDTQIKFTGCHGFCQRGPIVIVEPEGVLYTKVKVDDAPEIAHTHLHNNQLVERLLYLDPISEEPVPYYKDVNFYSKQTRIVLANCGRINPEDIDAYM